MLLDDSFTATSFDLLDWATYRFLTFDLASPTDGFQPIPALGKVMAIYRKIRSLEMAKQV